MNWGNILSITDLFSCFTQLQVNSKQVKFQISRNNFTIIKQSYRFDPKTTKCGQKKGTYLAYKVT